jgi:hypothetical protein
METATAALSYRRLRKVRGTSVVGLAGSNHKAADVVNYCLAAFFLK